MRSKKLEDYIAKNEKTKIVAKLQKVLQRLCAKMEGGHPTPDDYIWISLGASLIRNSCMVNPPPLESL